MAERICVPSWVELWQQQMDAAIAQMERHLGRALTDTERSRFMPPKLRQRLQAIDSAITENQPSEVVAGLIRQACEYDA